MLAPVKSALTRARSSLSQCGRTGLARSLVGSRARREVLVLRRSSPAVSEGGGVLNLEKGRVVFAELVANALDCRSDIRPIPVVPVACETFAGHAVVDRAIGHVAT